MLNLPIFTLWGPFFFLKPIAFFDWMCLVVFLNYWYTWLNIFRGLHQAPRHLCSLKVWPWKYISQRQPIYWPAQQIKKETEGSLHWCTKLQRMVVYCSGQPVRPAPGHWRNWCHCPLDRPFVDNPGANLALALGFCPDAEYLYFPINLNFVASIITYMLDVFRGEVYFNLQI